MKKDSWIASPFMLWVVIFTVVPLAMVCWYAFTDATGAFTLGNIETIGSYWGYLKDSLVMGAVATVFCLLLGYPVAYVMSRVNWVAQQTLMLLLMLPQWMNFLLRTYAWMTILENNGLINTLLGKIGIGPFQMINTKGAIILGMVYNFLPYMVLPLYVSISRIDESIIEAARDLGANSWQTLRHVLLPLSLPGIVSGSTMVFIPALTTFVISALLGGNKVLLVGNIIEQEFTAAYDWQLGSALSMVLMVFIILNILLETFTDSGEQGKKGRP